MVALFLWLLRILYTVSQKLFSHYNRPVDHYLFSALWTECKRVFLAITVKKLDGVAKEVLFGYKVILCFVAIRM